MHKQISQDDEIHNLYMLFEKKITWRARKASPINKFELDESRFKQMIEKIRAHKNGLKSEKAMKILFGPEFNSKSNSNKDRHLIRFKKKVQDILIECELVSVRLKGTENYLFPEEVKGNLGQHYLKTKRKRGADRYELKSRSYKKRKGEGNTKTQEKQNLSTEFSKKVIADIAKELIATFKQFFPQEGKMKNPTLPLTQMNFEALIEELSKVDELDTIKVMQILFDQRYHGRRRNKIITALREHPSLIATRKSAGRPLQYSLNKKYLEEKMQALCAEKNDSAKEVPDDNDDSPSSHSVIDDVDSLLAAILSDDSPNFHPVNIDNSGDRNSYIPKNLSELPTPQESAHDEPLTRGNHSAGEEEDRREEVGSISTNLAPQKPNYALGQNDYIYPVPALNQDICMPHISQLFIAYQQLKQQISEQQQQIQSLKDQQETLQRTNDCFLNIILSQLNTKPSLESSPLQTVVPPFQPDQGQFFNPPQTTPLQLTSARHESQDGVSNLEPSLYQIPLPSAGSESHDKAPGTGPGLFQRWNHQPSGDRTNAGNTNNPSTLRPSFG